jgi:hypothetical protein
MEAPKPQPSAEYQTVKTIGLSPITWLPITAAFAIACLLPVPWWAGTLVVGAAIASVVAIWKGQAERLYQVFKAAEAFNKQATAEQTEHELFTQLSYKGFDAAAENIAASIATAKKIQNVILENSWLETYEYGQTTRTLIEELRNRAKEIVAESTDVKPSGEHRRKETFAAERKALEETMENIQLLLNERGNETSSTQSTAEKLRRANEISRRARENARKAIDEQQQ